MNSFTGLDRISALRLIRKEIAELQTVERNLASPLLSNYKDIPKVLNAFLSITGTTSFGGTWEAVNSRKKFIFITIFLFAPGMILGDSMPKRLRAELGKALGLKAVSAISNNWADALFYYHQYDDFRDDVDRTTQKILTYLNVG
ncbi:MAG: hypothetical protein K2K08_09145 [Paramuribaculum sp.]|nr:hypothetical protein [Paramuribaculum sp.]